MYIRASAHTWPGTHSIMGVVIILYWHPWFQMAERPLYPEPGEEKRGKGRDGTYGQSSEGERKQGISTIVKSQL